MAGTEVELELHRRAGVLLGPESNQHIRPPAAKGAAVVQAGVAGGAQRYQQCAVVNCRAAVMDYQAVSGAAGPAGKAITGQDFVTPASEAPPGVAQARIAARA